MRPQVSVAAAYAGGFLGPFGGGVVSVMLPELRSSFGVSNSAAAASLTAYLVPFAAVQLVSGTLGERWGRAVTVRRAYVAYVAASLACAAAPGLWTFLGARALQGVANAFTTPLLLAALVDAVPAERRGRALGIFASAQASAQSAAPLLGGVCAAVSWRLAFVCTALAAVVLAAVPLPGDGRPAARAPWRPLLAPRLYPLYYAGFGAYAATSGLSFLVALRLGDGLDVGPDARGLLLAGFGAAGLLVGPRAGRLVDRFGARTCGAVAALCAGLLVGVLGIGHSVAAVTAVWVLVGIAATILVVSVNTLAVAAVPENRAGGVSATAALRFTGGALAPVLYLPAYHVSTVSGFAVAGACALSVTPALLLLRPAEAGGPAGIAGREETLTKED